MAMLHNRYMVFAHPIADLQKIGDGLRGGHQLAVPRQAPLLLQKLLQGAALAELQQGTVRLGELTAQQLADGLVVAGVPRCV